MLYKIRSVYILCFQNSRGQRVLSIQTVFLLLCYGGLFHSTDRRTDCFFYDGTEWREQNGQKRLLASDSQVSACCCCGQRNVHHCAQQGRFKSHNVVNDKKKHVLKKHQSSCSLYGFVFFCLYCSHLNKGRFKELLFFQNFTVCADNLLDFKHSVVFHMLRKLLTHLLCYYHRCQVRFQCSLLNLFSFINELLDALQLSVLWISVSLHTDWYPSQVYIDI